jgi:hypothetical protein
MLPGLSAKEDEMSGTRSTHSTDKKCMQYLFGESEGKGPFVIPTPKWENNIKMELMIYGVEI